MMQGRGREPVRWQSQSQSAKEVWKYFDEVLAKNLINHAIRKGDVTLFDLYYALAKLRAKCEWVKERKIETIDDIKKFAMSEMDELHDSEFGKLIITKQSHEPVLSDESTWGGDVVELICERLGNEMNVLCSHKKVALSYTEYDGLFHQPRIVLKEMEGIFKRLMAEQDMFEWLKLASIILYELANYVTITRGNAAVCEQIIRHSFALKFGKVFPGQIDLSVNLQDWTAFFETPDDYTNFYVISAAGCIIQSFERLPDETRQQLEGLSDLMMASPYLLDNNAKREKAWNKIKRYIADILHQFTLPDEYKTALLSLKMGELRFRQPSPPTLAIVRLMQRNGKFDLDELTAAMLKMNQVDKQTLSEVFKFEHQVEAEHFKSVGTQADETFKQRWYDLETLRCLEIKYRQGSFMLDKVSQMLAMHVKREVKLNYNYYVYPSAIKHPISHWVRISFTTPDEYASLSEGVLARLEAAYGNQSGDTFSMGLRKAISIGAIRPIDMHHFRESHLRILLSACALYLYHSHLFIRAKDIYAEKTEEMVENIVFLLERHFSDDELPFDVSRHKDQLVLEHSFKQAILMDTIPVRESFKRQRRGLFGMFAERGSGLQEKFEATVLTSGGLK